MKRVSQATWKLVHELWSPPGLWGRLTGQWKSITPKLDEIARTGEPGVIPPLSLFLRSPDQDVRTTAANGIGHLFSSVEPLDYLQLDQSMRNWTEYESLPNSPWRRLTPEELLELSRLPYGNLLLGVAAMHWSGYVREAAVERLAEVTDGSELPFLLLRVNDWVTAVRTRAAQALLSKAVPGYGEHFFRNLPLIEWLHDCHRAVHAKVIDAAEATLKTQHAIELLRHGLKSEDRWFRRKCFHLAADSAPTMRGVLLGESLSNLDGVVRLWAVRAVLPEMSAQELATAVTGLQRDPFMPVRREIVGMMAERLPDVAEAELLQGLFDSHSSVRALCRYHLDKLGIRDFRTRYREALISGTGKNRRLAIEGLGETGQSEDAAEVRPFLSDPVASVRKAAIRAMAHLAGSTVINELITCLLDVSPGVSREARLALQAHIAHIDVERLWNGFATETRFHIRKEILLLLFRLPTWKQTRFIFQACFDADEGVASIAQEHLRSWRKRAVRSYASRDDLKALDEILQRHGKQLGEGLVRELKFWIDSSK